MMLKKARILLTVIALSMLITTAAAEPETITIAENGISKAVIVVDTKASEPEKHAAAELADFLQQVTGAKFEITNDAGKSKSRLLVGPDAARLADAGFSTEGLGKEGLIIRTAGDDLILAGGRPRGTLYAVYTFLEDHVGCRWWMPTVSTIPKKPTLKTGKLDVRYVPPVEYRETTWRQAYDSNDWAARNKFNSKRGEKLGSKHGGRADFTGTSHHTFFRLIPPEKYFDEHPEWFSLINGERIHKRYFSSLCLTNEEMRKELIKNLKEHLRKNPEVVIASVSQPDGRKPQCQCEKCSAIDAEEGSPSGSLIRFVNSVAADIEKDFPHIEIDTLSYHSTQKPPKHVKPHHNVIIRLCSSYVSHSRPLSHDINKEFRDDIVGWSKISNKLYIWDYTTNFPNYIIPHPNLRTLGPNIRFYVAHGAKGIHEQGADNTYGGEMGALRGWMFAKLLWNPELDDQKLMEEFAHGYYGPAAEGILAYLDLMHDAVEKSGDYLGHRSPPTAKFLSLENLSKGWVHLKAAQESVKDNAELLLRVQVAQLPVMHIFMRRWEELRHKARSTGAEWPMGESIKNVFDHFMEVAEKANITRLRENHDGFDELEEAVLNAVL